VSVILIISEPSSAGDKKDEMLCGAISMPFALRVVVLLRRKSCVTAIPIDAKANDVRSHARNVRSTGCHSLLIPLALLGRVGAIEEIGHDAPKAR
jgi:hypothetical protein